MLNLNRMFIVNAVCPQIRRYSVKTPAIHSDYSQCDVIGQPDKHSNLRPVKFYIPPNESQAQKDYRVLRSEVQEWNQIFWSEHNKNFIKKREEFIAANKNIDGSTLNADKMSVFYKEFLDDNWKTHVAYNAEWYKRNFRILGLAFKVQLEDLMRKIKR